MALDPDQRAGADAPGEDVVRETVTEPAAVPAAEPDEGEASAIAKPPVRRRRASSAVASGENSAPTPAPDPTPPADPTSPSVSTSALRVTAPSPATGAVASVRLEDVSEDTTFRLRVPGDVSDLAAAIGRLGQLAPVELRPFPGASSSGPRWQVVAGFRRLEAVRLLQREAVLARLHDRLPDEDAWALALSQALLTELLTVEELETLRERLAAEGIAAWAQELVDDAKVRAPVAVELRERLHALLSELKDHELGAMVPGSEEAVPPEVEITTEDLARDLLVRLAALNQDLALAFEFWGDLPAETQSQLLEQARYIVDLLPFLERKAP